MKNKILYITLVYDGATNGGMIARKAICQALANSVGKENIHVITSELDHSEWAGSIIYQMHYFNSTKDKLFNLLCGNTTQISNKEIRDVTELIHKNKYDVVVFGCSESGKLIQAVKKMNIKIITFYNDIIASAIRTKIKNSFSLFYLPVALGELRAESMTTKLTDKCIVFNNRDAACLKRHWGRDADAVIPISVEDRFRENEVVAATDTDPLKLLFVGSFSWSPNEEGIRWFCDAVMKKLTGENVRFYIAGYGTEKLHEDAGIAAMDNVEILGTVDDLAGIYGQIDVVVSPILSGTGMKTKTAEALMHGKYILATDEALEGFISLDSALCRDENEFAGRIRDCCNKRPPRFIEANRKIYLENYSVQAVTKKIGTLLEIVY